MYPLRRVRHAVLPLQLDPAEPARDLGADPQVPVPLGLPHPSTHRRVPRLGRQRHRPDPVRREEVGLGGEVGPEVAAVPDRAGEAARAGPAHASSSARSPPRPPSRPGSPAGLPMVAASNDKACDVIGSGCLTPRSGLHQLRHHRHHQHPEPTSTSSCARCCRPTRRRSRASSTPRSAWSAGCGWSRGSRRSSGCRSGSPQPSGAGAGGAAGEAGPRTSRRARMGLICQPYWTPGPDLEPYAKGAVFGFGDVHTRAHLYRAILEGIVFALKEGAGAHGEEERGADPRDARHRRRFHERLHHADDRRHLRPVGPPGAHPGDLRDRCRRGRGRRDRCVPGCGHGRAGHDQGGGDVHPDPGQPGSATASCTPTCTRSPTIGSGRCTATSRGSPGTRSCDPRWVPPRDCCTVAGFGACEPATVQHSAPGGDNRATLAPRGSRRPGGLRPRVPTPRVVRPRCGAGCGPARTSSQPPGPARESATEP